MLLQNLTAIITGAAKGIGRGIALEMAREGADIIIADIDEKYASETKKKVEKLGRRAVFIKTDVKSYTDNQNLIDKTISIFGKIDILVNNAGIGTEHGLLRSSRKETSDVFKTNLTGPFFLTQNVAAEMIKSKTKGNILFTSSTHSHITRLDPAYSASKAAIEMFVKDAALELAEYGIRINAIAPGIVAISGEENTKNPHVPMGYSCVPEDIGKAMVFLASENACFITGQTLTVDGGFSLAHLHYWKIKGVIK